MLLAPRLVICAVLVLPAGFARADGLELSGVVSMGLVGGSGGPEAQSLRPMADLDLQVRLSNTTDGGLTLVLEYNPDEIETETRTTPPGIPRRR